MHLYISLCSNFCLYIHIRTCVYLYRYICTHTYICVCVCVCVRVCMCTLVHAHIYSRIKSMRIVFLFFVYHSCLFVFSRSHSFSSFLFFYSELSKLTLFIDQILLFTKDIQQEYFTFTRVRNKRYVSLLKNTRSQRT